MHMMKRMASLILALVMLLSAVPMTGFAAELENLQHQPALMTAEGSCGQNLYWHFDNGTLTISGTGAMEEYRYGSAPWYSYQHQITDLHLEEGITSICNSAFANTNNLCGTLVLPEGLTSIGNDAFNACTGLTGLELPSTLTRIGDSAFSNCLGMTGDLILPQSLTSLGKNAFRTSGFDGDIVIPDDITLIPYAVFSGMRKATSITFGENVSQIYVYKDRNFQTFDALYGMISVTEMTFHGLTPPVPTMEGVSPFASMTALETIYVPAEAMDAYQTAFDDFISDNVIICPIPMDDGPVAEGSCGENLTWSISDDGTLTISGTGAMDDYGWGEAPWSVYMDKFNTLNLEEGITTIGDHAFNGCYSLTGDLIIPSTVTQIGDYAFFECFSIDGDIRISEGVTRIGEFAFGVCGSPNSQLTMPKALVTLGNGAFYSNNAAGTLVIADEVEVLPSQVFAAMSNISAITFGEKVAQVYVSSNRSADYMDATYYMPSVKEVTFKGLIPAAPTTEGISFFESMTALETIYVPAAALDIYKAAYADLVPDTVTICTAPAEDNILDQGICGEDLTWNLSSDGTLTISGSGAMDDYELEGAPWYYYGEQIKALQLDDGITAIGSYAFADCSSITGELTIPATITAIGDSAFLYCSGYTGDLVIPDTVTAIGSGAFFCCSGFDGELILGKGIRSLPDTVFQDMVGITAITFTGAAPSVSSTALRGMTGVTKVTFREDIPALNSSALMPFLALTNLKTVHVPAAHYWECRDLLSGTGYANISVETDFSALALRRVDTGMVYSRTAVLTWEAHPGSVDSYVICRDGRQIGTTEAVCYTDTGMTPGKSHVYTVRAKLKDGTLTPETSITVTSRLPEVVSIQTESDTGRIGRDQASITVTVSDVGCEIKLYYLEHDRRVLIGSDSGESCTLSWDVTALEDGSYTLICAVTDPDGTGAEQTRTVTVDRGIPAKIPGMAATGAVDRIHLSWSIAAEADTDAYHLYRRAGLEAEFSLLARISGRNTLSYTDTAVNAEDIYYYYVVGVNEFGAEGLPSDTVGATLTPDTEAPVVTRLTPVNGAYLTGIVTPRLTAQDNVSVTETQIAYSLDEGETWVVMDPGAALDTTDLPDGPVRFRGLAWDAAGNVSAAYTCTCSIDNTGPEQVKGLSFESTSVTLTLRWQSVSDDDIHFFRVERKNADGSYSRQSDVYRTLGVNFYNLTPATAYTYRVVGYDIRGNRGIPSAEITAVTRADDIAPVITALTPAAGYYSEWIDLTVEASDAHTVSSMQIQVSTDRRNWETVCSNDFTLVASRQSLSCRLLLWDYAEGSIYVRAFAKDAAGNETGSGVNDPYVQYIVDRTAPAAPTGVTASDGSGSVEIRWEQGSEQDLGTYSVLRSDKDTGSFTVIASGLKTLNYFDRTALPGVTYFYKVCVYDRAGNESPLSAAVSAAAAPDTQVPAIVSIYPGGGSLGQGFKTVSVLASDDYGLDTVTLEYSLDGKTFTRLHSLSQIGQPTATVTAQMPLDRIAHGSTVLLRVSVTDLSGNTGEIREISYTVDKIAPGVTSARAEYADGSVRILWTGGNENDLAGYRVYRKEGVGGGYQLIAQRQAADKTDYACIDYDLSPARTTYYYKVEAVDTVGNTAAVVTSPVTLPDRTAPTPVLSCDSVLEVGVEYIFDASASADDGTITAYHLDFGDGNASTQQSAVHSYGETGTYTLRLTLTDNEGNQSVLTKEITVRDRSLLGSVKIRVVDETGTAVPGASVYFDLGASDQVIKTTDSSGCAVFTANVGSHTVGCFIADNQWLPAKRDVIVTAGDTTEAVLTLIHQPLVEGQFETNRMTFDEIVAAGIDPYVPENQHIVRVDVQLTYGTTKVDTSFAYNPATGETVAKPTIVDTPDGKKREIVPTVIHVGPAVSGGSNSGSGTGSSLDQAAVAYLDVPVGVSFMKEFFDVKLHIINNAAREFSMVDNVVQLNIPDGLSLVPSPGQNGHAVVTIPEIPGQTTETLSWILRGDAQGDYYLSADYSGVLEEFDAPVYTTFRATEPIKVWGLSAVKLTAEVNTIANFNAFYFNLSMENVSDSDIYLPSIGVLDNTITSYLKLAQKEAERVSGDTPNVRHLNTLLTNSSGYTQYIGTENTVKVLSPGEKITNKYAAYNVMGYNNVLYLNEAVATVAQGSGIDFTLIQTDLDLFPMDNAAEKLAEIKNDTDKLATFYYLRGNYNYFYVQESFNRDTNVGGLMAEGLYSGLKLILNLDAGYNTDQTRALTREIVAQLLVDESMQQVVDANVDTKYLKVTKAVMGAIAGSFTDDAQREDAEILGDYLNNSENVQGLGAALQQEGTSGFVHRLTNQLTALGFSAGGKAVIQQMYADNTIGSAIGSSVGEACGGIADVIEVVDTLASGWTESREMTNNLLRICAAQEEAVALVDMLIDYTDKDTAVYDELLAIREGMENAIRDMNQQFQNKMLEASGQIWFKEINKITLGYMDDIFGTNLGVVYTIAKVVFGAVDYVFDWGGSIADTHVLRVCTYLSLALTEAVNRYGLDCADETQAMYTLKALKYLVKLRLLGEQTFVNICNTMPEKKYQEYLDWVNSELGASYPTLDAFCADRMQHLLTCRDNLFAAYYTNPRIPDAPFVTLDYVRCTTEQEFSPEYEYSFDGTTWHSCTGNAIAFTPGDVVQHLSVRVKETAESVSGNIRRVTIPAKPYLLGDITIRHIDGIYHISGLKQGRYHYAFTNSSEGAEVSQTFVADAQGCAALEVSGDWTWLALVAAPREDDFASRTRYVPVTHHYRSEVVSATCTEGGCTRYTCFACGDSYTENPIEALGHSFTQYVSDGNATTAADGTKTSKCDRCEVTNTIPDPGSRLLADVIMTDPTPHHTGIIIRWNAVEGAQLYQIYRLASGETAWTLIKNTGSTAYKDETAAVGVKYYYKVRARDGQRMSSLNIQSVSAIRPLANVVMTGATPHATGNIIRWNAVEGAVFYQVYRLRSGETAWTLLKNTGSTAYKDETAVEGIKYYYKVRARNGQLMSSMNIASVSAIRPAAVTKLDNVTMEKAVGHATGNIIYWNAVKNAKLYQVYRLRSGETSWTLLKNTGSLAYKDETAEVGVKYYYKVVARNGDIKSGMNITSVSAVRPAK